jgi:protein TonB
VNRYLTYSSLIHAAALAVVAYFSFQAEKPQTYYGFQFLGGQSGFGTGQLEPAPAPLANPPAVAGKPAEIPVAPPDQSADPDRIALPREAEKPTSKKPAAEVEPQGKNTKKGKGTKDGRGEASFGHGDFQGSKSGPVGGIGTSLEIGGFGPGRAGLPVSPFPFKWYGELVYKRLWESWDRADAGTRECKVAFIIQKDGQVRDVRVKNSSGDSYFDMNAKRAVTAAAPFPPLPDGFEAKDLPVLVRFRLQ